MVYVQYFHKGVMSGKDIPACGDHAVLVLDGRRTMQTWHRDAVEANGYRRPTYTAYQLMRGETFTRSEPISNISSL